MNNWTDHHPLRSDFPQSVQYRQHLYSHSPPCSPTSSLGSLNDLDTEFDPASDSLPSEICENVPNEIQSEDGTVIDASSSNDSSQGYVVLQEPYGLAQAPYRFISDRESNMGIENLEFANMATQGLQTVNNSPLKYGLSILELQNASRSDYVGCVGRQETVFPVSEERLFFSRILPFIFARCSLALSIICVRSSISILALDPFILLDTMSKRFSWVTNLGLPFLIQDSVQDSSDDFLYILCKLLAEVTPTSLLLIIC